MGSLHSWLCCCLPRIRKWQGRSASMGTALDENLNELTYHPEWRVEIDSPTYVTDYSPTNLGSNGKEKIISFVDSSSLT